MVVGVLLLVGACSFRLPGTTAGSGASRTETRSVSGFTAIELAGTGDVQVKQAGTESLSVTAEENLLPLLTSDVVDKVLKLGVKEGSRSRRGRHREPDGHRRQDEHASSPGWRAPGR